MRLTLERKIILVTALFGLGSLCIIGLVIIPTIHNIKQLDQETYELRLSLERRYQNNINIRSMLAQVDQTKQAVALFSDHLLRPGHELDLITLLETLATKSGVTQRVVDSNLDSDHSKQIVMSLSIVGPYANVLSYLDGLEHSPYFITIDHLYLAPTITPDDQAGAGMVTLNLDVNLYVTP